MSALKELQNYTFISKYARWLPEQNRRETWKEAIDRVRDMMLTKYAHCNIDEDINWAYDMLYRKKILGSQRCLQFGGKPALDKNVRIYNCSASYCDRLRFFQEVFYVLLCGSGVGYSVLPKHIDKLPKFHEKVLNKEKLEIYKYTIPDTIEGWADSVGILLESYFIEPSDIIFDYSQIRPKGSYLSSSSGKAPGPEPLTNALNSIAKLLNRCIKNKQLKLRPIDAHDIICHLADATLSGGVRRASCLALFAPDDIDMMKCKTGDWLKENPQRARANNSVLLLRNQTSFEDFQKIFQYTKTYGEPGIVWGESEDTLTNPCGEIGLYGYYHDNITDEFSNKESGFGFCNLCTINCGNLKDEADFYERCKAAAIIGTLQAGFTDFSYLTQTTKKIVEHEALLGISMSGIMENYEIVLKPEVQKQGVSIIQQINERIAKKIGIKPAARVTCVKPDGQSGCLLSVSSGIHPHHSKRYIRRVQNNITENPYQYFKKHNLCACEKSVWSSNNTDENILFPIEVPDGAKTKNQIPALEMLKIIKSVQKYWINNGKVEDRCLQPWLSHAVSNTLFVKHNEWDEIIQYIYNNKEYFTGLTFISETGDKDYPQAPFTAVYTSREIVREYGDAAIWCSGLIELGLNAFDNNLWQACHLLLNNEESEKLLKATKNFNNYKQLFVHKSYNFAAKYFDGNMKKLVYCLQDVHNWKTYCDLIKSFKPVDYTQMIETKDNTKLESTIACSGGACLI